MAQDRRGDIAKIKRDLAKVSIAKSKIGNMLGENIKVNLDIAHLADAYIESAEIPQEDFKLKMEAINENIPISLKSINEKLSTFVDFLNDLLEKYEEEQRQWEEEQRRKEESTSRGKPALQ